MCIYIYILQYGWRQQWRRRRRRREAAAAAAAAANHIVYYYWAFHTIVSPLYRSKYNQNKTPQNLVLLDLRYNGR